MLFAFALPAFSVAQIGVPDGGDAVINSVPTDAFTPQEELAVIGALEQFYGAEFASEFAQGRDEGRFMLVKRLTGHLGASDATTIAVRCDLPPLLMATVVRHEYTHWTRSAAWVIPPGGGPAEPPPAGGRDPVTSGGDSNPCGALEHAKMGVCDLSDIGDRCADEDVSDLEKKLLKKNWLKMLAEINDMIRRSRDAGCPEALDALGNQLNAGGLAAQMDKNVTSRC